METPERKIPNYIFEDLLFRRRLEKTLNAEQERLNALLAEHVRLLEERRALMAEVHEGVQRRLEAEERGEPRSQATAVTEEAVDGD